MIRTIVASALAVGLLAAPAAADIFMVTVEMSGLQENPPNASPAFGSADVTVDTVSGLVSISGVFSGLVAPATAAHLHGLAPAGANAGVLFGLTVVGGTSGTFSGAGVLSAANLAGLLSDLTYINLHTSVFPGGEIRGQVLVPAPATALLAVVAPFVRRRRRN